MSIFDFGVDLWIELIISNELSNQDIFNLTTTCKFFSQFLKNEKLLQFIEDRNIYFGIYESENEGEQELSYMAEIKVAWSADNRTIASGHNANKILIWNTKTGKVKNNLKSSFIAKNRDIQCLAFHPQNANLLAVASSDAYLCLWDIEKSEIKFRVESVGAISTLAFEPQGRFLASVGLRDSARKWNIETGKCERKFSIWPDFLYCVLFSKDAKFLAASDNSNIFIWNFETCEIVQQIKQGNLSFLIRRPFFQFFDDNQTLVLINVYDRFVKFYDFKSGEEKKELSFENCGNYDCEFLVLHPNQKIIALGGRSGLEIWDIQAKKLLRQKKIRVSDLSFSPNGKALTVVKIVGRDQSSFEVFDMKKYL